jgi:hypothetical protein
MLQPKPGIRPPAIRTRPAAALPTVPGSAVQLADNVCTCGKPGNKHKSNCPRNKKNLGAKAKKVKIAHQESGSWLNMKKYRAPWVGANDITESKVKAFVKSYGQIRGHHTGSPDKDDGEQAVTTQDLNAYKNWHTQQYGYWYG